MDPMFYMNLRILSEVKDTFVFYIAYHFVWTDEGEIQEEQNSVPSITSNRSNTVKSHKNYKYS